MTGMPAAPLRYQRDLSATADWEMAMGEPIAALRPFVIRYCWYVDRAPIIRRHLHLPHTGIVLIISLGTRMKVVDPRNPATFEREHGTFIAGLFETEVFTDYLGESTGIQVDLTPMGARRIFDVPMDQLSNRAVGAHDLLGSDWRRLEERLLDLSAPDEQVEVIEAFLLRRIANSEPAPKAIRHAWRELRVSGGNADISALAEETGLGHKRLIREFRNHIGLPPRAAGRTIRFERAVASLQRDTRLSLSDIAAGCGYYDQAHFNREFRAFSGMTPRDYLARVLPAGGGVSGE